MSHAKKVSVLFARKDSNYKSLDGIDVWDAERDARKWPGGNALITHPPCRLWGRLRQFAKGSEDEKELAIFAVEQIRLWGGVLEHPAYSTLWKAASLPVPGRRDKFGGWTLPVHQHWWGHRAEKATWLYVLGCESVELPDIPLVLGKATHCIRPTKGYPRLPSVTKAEREHTPLEFARWLVEVARRVGSYSGYLQRVV
ncbi:hypothetical protein [Microbulbifer variabilis]|uniref:hypothetical protein n=1 Tax=Microbulbifer variabilis TaxID=266805 RepID=UPI0003818F61|nr:hypothetical protein [Microbulbifer variabilis]